MTGVQTCALPISKLKRSNSKLEQARNLSQVVLHRAELDLGLAKGQIADITGQLLFPKAKTADPSRRITAASAVPCQRDR